MSLQSTLLYNQSRPQTTAPPTLPITLLTSMAQRAWQDEYTTIEIESLVVSLIGQGFLKAYIAHSRGLIVFQKGPKMGFEPFVSMYND